MQYMLVYLETAAEFDKRNDPPESNPYWRAWMTYLGAMREAGVLSSGNGLQAPHTATTVRVRDGKRQIEDGPFADSKEQLGGYVILEVPNLDAAIEWAAKSPSASVASVEIRPVLPPMKQK